MSFTNQRHLCIWSFESPPVLNSLRHRAAPPASLRAPANGHRPSGRGACLPVHQPGETVVIDLFFAFDELHGVVLDRAVVRPFIHSGVRHELRFLSAEDLTIFKMSSGRTKDWVDIYAMVTAGTPIDADYVERELVHFKGPTAYPSVARLRAMLQGLPQ
jgi:hypothetical protein